MHLTCKLTCLELYLGSWHYYHADKSDAQITCRCVLFASVCVSIRTHVSESRLSHESFTLNYVVYLFVALLYLATIREDPNLHIWVKEKSVVRHWESKNIERQLLHFLYTFVESVLKRSYTIMCSGCYKHVSHVSHVQCRALFNQRTRRIYNGRWLSV